LWHIHVYLSLLDSDLQQLKSPGSKYDLEPETPRGQWVWEGFPGELTDKLRAQSGLKHCFGECDSGTWSRSHISSISMFSLPTERGTSNWEHAQGWVKWQLCKRAPERLLLLGFDQGSPNSSALSRDSLWPDHGPTGKGTTKRAGAHTSPRWELGLGTAEKG